MKLAVMTKRLWERPVDRQTLAELAPLLIPYKARDGPTGK